MPSVTATPLAKIAPKRLALENLARQNDDDPAERAAQRGRDLMICSRPHSEPA